MNAMELNAKKTALATLITQKAITSDTIVLELLNTKIKEIESEVAAATKHEALPAQIEKAVQHLMVMDDSRKPLGSLFEDTDVKTAVGIVTNTVNNLWFRLFGLNAWYESLGARMGQSFNASNSAMYGVQPQRDPESDMIECQKQVQDVLAEVARWINEYHALVARAEAEGIELEMGQNPNAGARDALPTCEHAHNVYVASRERKEFRREAERKMVKSAQPTVFSMLKTA